jgi:hypothetical protein
MKLRLSSRLISTPSPLPGGTGGRGALGAERLGATGGEQAGFEAGGAEDGLLAEGHALEGEQFLGIDGAVGWREVGVEVGDFWMSSRRTTVKLADAKPCLRAFWEERALPVSRVGPVKRAVLAGLAGKLLFGDGACSSAIGANRIRAREYPFAQHLATARARVRNRVRQLIGNKANIFGKIGERRTKLAGYESLRFRKLASPRPNAANLRYGRNRFGCRSR